MGKMKAIEKLEVPRIPERGMRLPYSIVKRGPADVSPIKEYRNHDSVSTISIIPDPLLHNSSIVD
jgi:hypothetical protein